MQVEQFHVVKITIKTDCDISREMVKAHMPKRKALALRDKLEGKNECETFDPHSLVSYLVEPAS